MDPATGLYVCARVPAGIGDMPSFKGDELPLREACWLLSDPSATSGLCASFGKRRRTSRQSCFAWIPVCLLKVRMRSLPAGALFGPGDALFSTPVRESRRGDVGYAGNRFASSSPCSSTSLKDDSIQSRTDAPRKGALARAGAAIGLKEHPSSAAIDLGRLSPGPSSASWRLPCVLAGAGR